MTVSLTNAQPTVLLTLTYREALFLQEICNKASIPEPLIPAYLSDAADQFWNELHKAGLEAPK